MLAILIFLGNSPALWTCNDFPYQYASNYTPMLLLIQAYIFGGDDAFLRTKCFGLENGPHYDDELFLSLNAIMIYRRIVKNITQMVLLVKKAVSTDSVCEIGGVGAAAVNGWIPPVSA